MINPNKTKVIKELGPVDISTILKEITDLPESKWDEENKGKPNKFYELKETKHIIFKFVREVQDCTSVYEFPIWESWKAKLQPILDKAVEPYGYKDGVFSRIMLAKLCKGGSIKAHVDGNTAATFPHKIHIPITTNDKVTFFVNPKIQHFEIGHAYEVNNYAVHYAENLGDEDRIHLICEYYSEGHLPK